MKKIQSIFAKLPANFIRACLACWLSVVIIFEGIVIAYVCGYINFDKAERFLNNCSNNYYYSEIVIKNDLYYFDRALECEKDFEFDCAKSMKNESVYNETRQLDLATINFIKKIPDDFVNSIDDLPSLRKYASINDLLNRLTPDLEKTWFKKQKDKIYIITTSKSKRFCDNLAESTLREI